MLPTPVRAALHVMLQWGKMKAMFDALDGHVHEFRQHAGQAWADISVQALAVTKYAQLDGRDGHGVDWWAEIVREVLCKVSEQLLGLGMRQQFCFWDTFCFLT